MVLREKAIAAIPVGENSSQFTVIPLVCPDVSGRGKLFPVCKGYFLDPDNPADNVRFKFSKEYTNLEIHIQSLVKQM
jgi:hypothetical protein